MTWQWRTIEARCGCCERQFFASAEKECTMVYTSATTELNSSRIIIRSLANTFQLTKMQWAPKSQANQLNKLHVPEFIYNSNAYCHEIPKIVRISDFQKVFDVKCLTILMSYLFFVVLHQSFPLVYLQRRKWATLRMVVVFKVSEKIFTHMQDYEVIRIKCFPSSLSPCGRRALYYYYPI